MLYINIHQFHVKERTANVILEHTEKVHQADRRIATDGPLYPGLLS